MFSPEASVPPSQPAGGASLRNPRRRRRIESDTQRRPVKRSRIASDQFQPAVNGHVAAPPLNGAAAAHRAAVDVPVRGARVSGGSAALDSGNVLVWRLAPRFRR
jgi:hypothetical protein